MIFSRVAPALLLLTFVLGACKKAEVQSYRVTKETPPSAATPAANSPAAMPGAPAPAPAGATMANTPVPTASGAALAWTAPAHWTAKDPGGMRKGSYTVKGDGSGDGDLSVTAFPGDVGGDLANVNRWRGQIGLAAIAEAELAATTQHLDRNGLHITLVVLTGSPQSILGAIVPHAGATWFFKLTGPAALVAKETTAFTAFLDTVKPAAK